MIDLASRNILVIGGTGNIGGAVVERARAAGASVVATASSGASLPNGADDKLRWRELDITRRDVVGDLMADIGGITDVVLAAAEHPTARLIDMQGEELSALVDAKLWGAFHVGRAADEHLPQNGTLTLISGVVTDGTKVSSPNVAISAAVEAYGRGLAAELAPIRVNVVSPGPLGSTGRGMHKGTASDVADAILAIVCNEWMSGSVVELHGAARL